MRSLVEVLGKREARQCPACGVVIMKASGDNTMMCGCEGRPAGGTYERALANGGCGHEFDFVTLAPLGGGRPGQPVNGKQVSNDTALGASPRVCPNHSVAEQRRWSLCAHFATPSVLRSTLGSPTCDVWSRRLRGQRRPLLASCFGSVTLIFCRSHRDVAWFRLG